MKFSTSPRRFRGSLLVSVLFMLTIGLTCGLVLGASATVDLTYAKQTEAGRTARRLASSALHKAIAEITKDPKFSSDIDLTSSEGVARIRFAANNPEGLIASTNNWEGKNPNGYLRGVPQGMIQLIASSEVRGVRRKLEMLVDLPVYPLSVACSGPIHLAGATVASIKDEQLELSLAQLSTSQLGPGHLASNSLRSPDSVLLESDARITGFVQSRGAIQNRGAEVGGGLRENWKEDAELPLMSANEFDPKRPDPKQEEVLYSELGPSYTDLELSQRSRRTGSVSISGKLTLNDCMLFVDGDLTINGGLEGQGAVAATGQVKISGSSALRAQSRVAVIADGNIQISGASKQTHKFQGILYGKGTISVEKVTLLGSCIQNAPPSSAANQDGVTIRDANVIWAPLTSGPAFDPPIDILLPAGDTAELGKSSVELKQMFANSVDQTDVITGKGMHKGQPSEAGTITVEPNNFNSDDIVLLRSGYRDHQLPEYMMLLWGRNVDTTPALNPDGSRRLIGFFYPSTAALLELPLSSLIGTQAELESAFFTSARPYSGILNGFNLPKSLWVGCPLHPATPLDGATTGCFSLVGAGPAYETTLRANLRQTIIDLEAKRDQLRRRNSNRKHYFSLDPSRFLSRSRSVRVHYLREL